jgi:hypothetical protein
MEPEVGIMATGTFEYRSEAERKSIERAIAFASEMHDLALSAPEGQVLDLCEGQALDLGRDLLRETLQAALQTRIEAVEVKKGRHDGVSVGAPSTKNGGVNGA